MNSLLKTKTGISELKGYLIQNKYRQVNSLAGSILETWLRDVKYSQSLTQTTDTLNTLINDKHIQFFWNEISSIIDKKRGEPHTIKLIDFLGIAFNFIKDERNAADHTVDQAMSLYHSIIITHTIISLEKILESWVENNKLMHPSFD